MGTSNMIKVLNVSTESSVLSVETSFFPDRAPEIHYVTLAGSEALQFQEALTTYPFGINQEHLYFIETLSESGNIYFCNVRITSLGSRQRKKIEISAATYSSLQQVFNSNIISEGYVNG
jgi:aspartate/tyrosine/aromatic aminotransferase